MPRLITATEARQYLGALNEGLAHHAAEGTLDTDTARRAQAALDKFTTTYRVIGNLPDAPARPERRSGRGDGQTSGGGQRSKWAASEKSTDFLFRLATERGLVTDELLKAAVGWTRAELRRDQKRTSQAIDAIKALPRPAAVRPVRAQTSPQVGDGFYYYQGQAVKVQRSLSSNRLYAKVLTLHTEGTETWSTWELTPNLVGKLTPEDAMTPERARMLGSDPTSALYGWCFKCGARLTDEHSMADGIGPYCKNKMGW